VVTSKPNTRQCKTIRFANTPEHIQIVGDRAKPDLRPTTLVDRRNHMGESNRLLNFVCLYKLTV
jgi:hypothetical protein